MSDLADPSKQIGSTTRVGELDEAAEAAGPAPGKQSKSAGLDPKSPSLFSGDEEWEPVAEPASEADAEADAADIMAEVTAGLAEEMTALTEEHRCYAGCMHGQFDSMMSAYADAETSSGSAFKIAPGAIEEAARRAQGGEEATPKTPGATTAAPESPTVPTEGAIAHAGGTDEVGFAGTVSPAKPGGFPGVLGLAKWNYGKFGYPDLKVDAAKQTDKSWTATVKPTTATDAPTSAVATPAGTYGIGSQTLKNPDTNKNVKLAKSLEVGAAAAAQIAVAEQEHLDDVSMAYELTLKAAADAVNAQTTASFNEPTKAGAIKAAKDAVAAPLDAKLAASPTKWRAMLQTCANLTRSGRDASKWHSFDYFADGNDIDFTAKTITYKVLNNPNVGTTSSAALIQIP